MRTSFILFVCFLCSSANPAATLLDPPYRQLHWTYLASFSSWLLFQPSHLSPEYSGSTIPLVTRFTDYRNLVSIATVFAYAVLGVSLFGKERGDLSKRVGVLALSLLVLPYLPASNLFFPVGFVVAERVLYLPSMGFCMLVGFGAYKLTQNCNKLASNFSKILLISLLVFSSIKTALQNRVWYSEKDLYVSGIRSYPTNSKMWHNLGTQTDGGIALEQSVWLMRRSIEIDPTYIPAHTDLGLVLTQLNDKEGAEKVCACVCMCACVCVHVCVKFLCYGIVHPNTITQALKRAVYLVEEKLNNTQHISQRDVVAYVRLANLIKTNQTRLPEALHLCRTVLEKVPDYFRGLREAGHVLLHMGRLAEARDYLQQALELQPSEPNVNFLLGVAEGELGNLNAAERSIEKAMGLSSESNARMYASELSSILRRKGKEKEAEALMANFAHTN